MGQKSRDLFWTHYSKILGYFPLVLISQNKFYVPFLFFSSLQLGLFPGMFKPHVKAFGHFSRSQTLFFYKWAKSILLLITNSVVGNVYIVRSSDKFIISVGSAMVHWLPGGRCLKR